ncbi:hypothetical protein Back11_06140 [Paenibacillus baekrokdamisoli]|uniref:Uncharacterized protein n=1 Tax=Paenibacillus baekrokdamisoli TaxID=1712516 RepID=A0A3G9J894_9BACL|nr:hypothetical protein [Paenibacillus baekrokdamisoli]MBB3067546.1 hypothetical protein [Paenibacillus baekrokdamisoli]BBH19269.1 hypothetical protein Back11_06140 [Paenibacillus baekrokdamisoli]
MRYLGLLDTYKEYLPVTDQDPNIAIKSVNAEPLVLEDSEEAVMEAIRKLQGGDK